MKKIRGWKTVIVAICLSLTAAINRLVEEGYQLPPFVLEQLAPILMIVMRCITSTPVGRADAVPKMKSNQLPRQN